MINVKKGILHSLQQTDYRGTNPNPAAYGSGTALYAGMFCYITAAGAVAVVPTTATGTSSFLRGFAINNNFDGDAIESKTIALYALDGASIIETDQVDLLADGGGTTPLALTAANYPIGTALYASTLAQSNPTAGLVSKLPGTSGLPSTQIIGWVQGIRFLQNCTPYPVGVSATQSYISATETAAYNAESANSATGSNGLPIYTPTTGSYTYKPQVNVAVLAIKLAAA
jgi:hypothetical protein